jgi:hypothetical protein
MRGGAVAGGRRRGRPPDGASCSRRAGLQQCKSLSRPALPHQRWLVVVWLAVVSSVDGLYAVAL